MRAAQYYAELARAWNGGVTREQMMWEISLVEGWSMIHAAGLLNGEAWIWPDARLSEAGRTMLSLREAGRQVMESDAWVDLTGL